MPFDTFNDPSDLQETVALLSKTAKLEERGVAKSLTVRMPLPVFSTVKAMADYSGLSINRVAIQLLRVGISAVQEALPDDDARAIYDAYSLIAQELAAEVKPEQLQEAD